ncbi:putative membrane protein [Arthrobacter sp. UYCu511]|uniref:anthrone oxygenase family protein n=1 Tax=Arthrobacter sp. UYCu511 TaxID=3156337 RepID=UPI00339462D1
MTSTFISAVTITSALGAGVTGGVYFAFSAIVMPALRTLPVTDAITAMQRINNSAVRLPFMTVFFAGAAASAAVVVSETATGGAALENPSRMVGAALALASFGITVARNVPLNNALARVAPDSLESAAQWTAFERRWSTANLLRGSTAVAATILLADPLSRAS